MKSTYEFTKILSVLFLLSGIGFIFSNLYVLAAIGIGAFLVIRIIDSNWVFNAMQLDNPSSFVVTITFIVLCVYGFFIYNEMKFAPLLTSVTPEHQTAYLEFEKEISNVFTKCSDAHNKLLDKMDYGIDITEKEQKDTNKICFNISSDIEKIQLAEDFPKSIRNIALKDKSDYKKIAINLSSYQYSEKASQDALIARIKDSIKNITANTERIRLSLNIKSEEDKAVPVAVKF